MSVTDNFYINPLEELSGWLCSFKISHLCLFLALILYALWGSPTPNQPGIVELIIALSLIGFIGFSALYKVCLISKGTVSPAWMVAGKFLLFYGLIVPLIVALSRDVSITHIIRDLVGFFFLCLPIFLVPVILKNQADKVFLIGLLFIGALFSMRVLWSSFELFKQDQELLYLANSPLVLFSTLFFIGYAFKALYKQVTIHSFTLFIGLILISAIMSLAMFADIQRATFGALVLTTLSLAAIGLFHAPLRMIMPILVIFVIGFFLWPYWLEISGDMAQKTAQVGVNMRFHELQAVWDAVNVQPLNILFGLGWGAQYASPAVGGLDVTFTHSLLTYMFLKTGVIGLGVTLVYLFFVFEKFVRLYLIDPVKGNALIWPFIIPIILYASYKSFDFGLLLTLMIIFVEIRNNPNEERSAS